MALGCVVGKVWSAHLPVVTLNRGEPKPITLVVPYYENPVFFARQIRHWATLSNQLSQWVTVLVVDDGSPTAPATDALEQEQFLAQRTALRLFRIEQDVRWNWLAARNIGVHEAADGWVLLTDMDHVVPEETLDALVHGQAKANTIYGFSRVEHTGDVIGPHPNSWFLTRSMFWKVGGYDETLSGHYGTDGDWRRRCAQTAPMAILRDHLVRHEFVADASTSRYKRKQPEDAAVSRIVGARGKGWRPKILSFPYREVTA